jgi:serine/threonine protein kinase
LDQLNNSDAFRKIFYERIVKHVHATIQLCVEDTTRRRDIALKILNLKVDNKLTMTVYKLFCDIEGIRGRVLGLPEIFPTVLASGVQGTIYCGTWKGEELAIKVLKKDILNSDLCFKEAILHGVASHFKLEFILPVTGILMVEGLPRIIMPRMTGNLGELIPQGLDYGCRFQISLDIGHGIANIHQLDLIHRDIKPENILWKKESGVLSIYIADFGVANWASISDTPIGSLRYMAPELRNDQPYGKCVDMYSYGVVMWELWEQTRLTSGTITKCKRAPENIQTLIFKCLKQPPRLTAEEACSFLETTDTNGR